MDFRTLFPFGCKWNDPVAAERIQWQHKDPWGVCNQNKIWNKSALSMGVLCVLYKVCRKKKIATHLVKNIFCVTQWKTHLGHTAQMWHFATLHWEQLLVFDRQCLYWCRNAVCSTWLFHTCDMTHSHVWPTWLIHTCDMTRLYVCHDPFICVPWPIHMCAMTHSYVCHDSFICVTWLLRVSRNTARSASGSTTGSQHFTGRVFVTRLIHTCDVTDS